MRIILFSLLLISFKGYGQSAGILTSIVDSLQSSGIPFTGSVKYENLYKYRKEKGLTCFFNDTDTLFIEPSKYKFLKIGNKVYEIKTVLEEVKIKLDCTDSYSPLNKIKNKNFLFYQNSNGGIFSFKSIDTIDRTIERMDSIANNKIDKIIGKKVITKVDY